MLRSPMIAPTLSSLRHHFPALRRGLPLTVRPLPVLPTALKPPGDANPAFRPSLPNLAPLSR